jgi:hypothetical protein
MRTCHMYMKLQSSLGPALGKGTEYADLMALAERCALADLEREKLAPVDPQQVLDWVHAKTATGFANYDGRNGTSG